MKRETKQKTADMGLILFGISIATFAYTTFDFTTPGLIGLGFGLAFTCLGVILIIIPQIHKKDMMKNTYTHIKERIGGTKT